MSSDSGFAHLKNLTTNEWLISILFALLLVALTALVTRIVVHMIRKYLNRDEVTLPSSSIIINIVRVLMWSLGICMILDTCFGVNATALIAALGVGGIALSLGFQDTIANLIGGLQLTFMRLVAPGDYIEVGGSMGVVKDVTWRHTSIDNKAGEVVIIPNSVISKTALVHVVDPGSVKVPFSISSKIEDIDVASEKLLKVAKEAIYELAEIDGDITLQFTSITELAILGNVSFSLVDNNQKGIVVDAVVRAIAREARTLVA